MSAMGSAQSEGSRLQRARLVDLTHVPTLKALLERHGLAPTKKFGQHFLVSDRVVSAILQRVQQEKFKGILEVGPGPGVLTAQLCLHAQVTAVEIDPIAVSALSESAPEAKVIPGDALKIDLDSLIQELPEPRAIVSNMPYNITGPLLTRFTEIRHRIELAVLMMQKEVGERVMAPSGNSDFGSLSVFLQSRFRISKVCDAPSGAFFPPPKVESVVLAFQPCGYIPVEIDRAHQQIVRLAFHQPRKTLANNLAGELGRDVVLEQLAKLDLPAMIRPHQVSLDQYRELAREFSDRWALKH